MFRLFLSLRACVRAAIPSILDNAGLLRQKDASQRQLLVIRQCFGYFCHCEHVYAKQSLRHLTTRDCFGKKRLVKTAFGDTSMFRLFLSLRACVREAIPSILDNAGLLRQKDASQRQLLVIRQCFVYFCHCEHVYAQQSLRYLTTRDCFGKKTPRKDSF